MQLVPVTSSTTEQSERDPAVAALADKLRKLRRRCEAWEQARACFVAEHDAAIARCDSEFVAADMSVVLAVEQRMKHLRVDASLQDAISTLIYFVALTHLDRPATPADLRATLTSIHDRHSTISYAALRKIRVAHIAHEAGLAVERIDTMDADEAEAWLRTEIDRRMQEQAESIFGREASSEEQGWPPDPPQKRKNEGPGHSRLRALYRALIRWIHPDREHDSERRREKTELMKRINSAYHAGDLHALTELQTEAGMVTAGGSVERSGEEQDDLIRNMTHQIRQAERALAQIRTSIRGHASEICPLPTRLTLKGLQSALAAMQAEINFEVEESKLLTASLQHMDVHELLDVLEDVAIDLHLIG